jgi:quercetin dioxygenase-like cupin family protein
MKERLSPETTVKKIDSRYSPHGAMGQRYLASGTHLALRKWDEEPGGEALRTRREYETVGYVIGGRAELEVEGQTVLLQPGDSWLVPPNAEHCYRILESFSAVEATAPPSHVHDRDAPPDRPSPARHDPPAWRRAREMSGGRARHHDPLSSGRPGSMRPLAEATLGGSSSSTEDDQD